MSSPVVVTYGSDPHQWGEFACPRHVERPGLVVNIHGGFWRSAYDLSHARGFCMGLRRAGWATLNLEYRRVGNDGGGWPGTFDDVTAGVNLVAELAHDHDLDADRVVVSGHSAGGHLALWVASDTHTPLAGVVAVGAVCDLVASHTAGLSEGGSAAIDLMGVAPEADPQRWAAHSPVERVPLAVPTVLIHGSQDDQVPLGQPQAYVEAAVAAGADTRLEVIEGDDHLDVLDPGSSTFAATVAAIDQLTHS